MNDNLILIAVGVICLVLFNKRNRKYPPLGGL